MPIQNTKVVMYIAHIWGLRFPAIPMPKYTWSTQQKIPPARIRAMSDIHAK
jgi:hypothetical protein